MLLWSGGVLVRMLFGVRQRRCSCCRRSDLRRLSFVQISSVMTSWSQWSRECCCRALSPLPVLCVGRSILVFWRFGFVWFVGWYDSAVLQVSMDEILSVLCVEIPPLRVCVATGWIWSWWCVFWWLYCASLGYVWDWIFLKNDLWCFMGFGRLDLIFYSKSITYLLLCN